MRSDVHESSTRPAAAPRPRAERASGNTVCLCRRGRRRVVRALLACLATLACASPQTRAPATARDGNLASDLRGAPSWVLRGCGEALKQERTLVCGVGSAGGSRNISLARTTAVGRARTEIARSLQTKLKAMLKDYQATTTGGAELAAAAADEQYVVDVSKQITQLSLAGTEQRETWLSPTGTLFVLVVLDIERFEQSLAQMNDLSEEIRRAVRERARSAFDELDRETESGGPSAPRPARSTPVQLITPEEAALPDDTQVWRRKKSSADGPGIEISSPSEESTYDGPFPINVRFTVGTSGQPVDMDSLKLEYKKAWGIDITSRVRDYIVEDGIRVDAADLPGGRHSVEIFISDVEKNRSSRIFTVTVEKD